MLRHHHPPNRPIVLIFAKAVRAGQVKTRLAMELGTELATSLAQAFLEDTLDSVTRLPWARTVLVTTGPITAHLVRSRPVEVWSQGEGDLGARLERALRRALRKERAPFALAIGSDSPGLPEPFFDEARSCLHLDKAVVGPCDSDGFYLVGLRQCPKGLFAHLPWSSPGTLPATLERLRRHDLSPALLDGWFDVDRPADLVRLHRLIAAGHVRAPRTAEVLSEAQGLTSPGSWSPAALPV